MRLARTTRTGTVLALAMLACVGMPTGLGLAPQTATAQKADDFPPFEKVSEGLEKVVSSADGTAGLYDLYKDQKTGKLLGVLPRNYDSQLIMIACTVSGGDSQAGVMGPTYYAKWQRYDKQLALVMPNLNVRTDGDKQAQDSVNELFTGRVLVTVPIVSETGGRPVIDLGALMTRNAGSFFRFSAYGGYGPSVRGVNASLIKLTKAKSFPKNFVVEYELPDSSGRLIRLTYSVGNLEGTPGFKPRKADPRVGYFYDYYQDYAKPANAEITERYINRWYVEKADSSLKMSPPKQPIVWYIEHTTPVKFRRYVREGIALWNEAYREIGIDGAIVVYQQDADTGAHMDKDPEDARYNFFRWNSSDQSYAIGPSRTNPQTGEILDADVVWHQGLTRSVRNMLEGLSDDITENAFTPETLAFFAEHPEWDPRIRLSPPGERERRQRELALEVEAHGADPFGEQGHPLAPEAFDHTNQACRIGNMLAADLSLFDAAMAASLVEGGDEADLLDGIPEDYIGPMIRYISCHEVGHCLGLQHNMAASTIRKLSDVHSGHWDGGATSGSVMDYIAANINYKLGEAQGPYATPTVGPYDRWAIAYGYGPDKGLDDLLKRSSEPDLIFLSQSEMSSGSDPRNMTWDNGANNLNFCESRIGLVNELRAKLVSDIVDDGESWALVRRRFSNLLGTQVQCLHVASRWIGGTFSNNDFKAEGGRAAIEDVPVDQQRRALKLIIDNAFNEEAFGLTPELVRHMGKEYWWDDAGLDELMDDPSFTVHDMVGGVQAVALTFVMNPDTLRRVYDNEFRTAGQDELTLAEVVDTVSDAVWASAAGAKSGSYSASEPMISSFDRNLQREHTDRLITLALMDRTTSPAMRTISTLATQELKKIDGIAGKAESANPDTYTAAHLSDVRTRIGKALDAAYVVTR